MLNFNRKQSLITLGRTALLAVGVLFASTVSAADPWSADLAELSTDLSKEASIRASRDTQLALDIADVSISVDTERTRAVKRENELSSEITEVATDLSKEASIRASRDTQLALDIASETTRATNKENELRNSIGDHKNIHSVNTEINDAAKTSLSAGLEAAGNAIGNMAFNNTHYISKDQDLSRAVRTLDSNLNRIENHFNSQINRLENKLDKYHHEMKRGFASLAAMSRLVPNPRACGDTQISVGVGHYHGSTGVAIGAFHYIDNNTLVNVGVGYSGHDSATFGVGLTFGF